MKTHSVLAPDLQHFLGLMEKQIKRVAELGRFLPFADQQEEMNVLVTNLNVEADYLRRHVSIPADSADRETTEIPYQATLDTGTGS